MQSQGVPHEVHRHGIQAVLRVQLLRHAMAGLLQGRSKVKQPREGSTQLGSIACLTLARPRLASSQIEVPHRHRHPPQVLALVGLGVGRVVLLDVPAFPGT